jgi:hypothetical protein
VCIWLSVAFEAGIFNCMVDFKVCVITGSFCYEFTGMKK